MIKFKVASFKLNKPICPKPTFFMGKKSYQSVYRLYFVDK